MAKSVKSAGEKEPTAAQSALVDFAEDLGRILGAATAKAESWLNQRTQVTEQLTNIRDTAGRLLEQLGATSAASTVKVAVRRGRPKAQAAVAAAAAEARRGARKGRKLSEETKQKMRDAWARRKAKMAKAKKG